MKFSSDESIRIKRTIIERLVSKRVWGGKHIDYVYIASGFPSNMKKIVLKIADELIKEGLIVKKPTGYGLQIYLNINMKSEIMRYISE